MECFVDFIGVKGFCNAPTSGLFLNQEGVTSRFLNNIINEDYEDGEQLADEKVESAIGLVAQEVNNHFAGKINENSLVTSDRIGVNQKNKKLIPGAADTLKGIELEVCNESAFLDLYISEINLFVDFTGSVDVEFWDVVQSKLLATKTIEAIAGEIVTIYTDLTLKSPKKRLHLAIVYNTTTVNSYETLTGTTGCRSCGAKRKRRNQFVDIAGASLLSTSPKLESNITRSSDTAGLSICYSVNCSKTDWLCAIRNLLAIPVLYKSAILIYEYALYDSRRGTTEVMINETDMQNKLKLLEAKYNDWMSNQLGNINLPQGICFKCNNLVARVHNVP